MADGGPERMRFGLMSRGEGMFPHIGIGREGGWRPVLSSVLVVGLIWWASAAGTRSSLRRRIDAILSDPSLRGARISCRVVELRSGRVLYSYHATDPLIPASNMKLVTTAAALEILGLGYRFTTRVGFVGRDLVVIGGGDPNISGRFFGGRITAVLEAWARELRRRGIRCIEGDLVGDDTLFDRCYRHPTWPRNQLSRWYCAPVGALSLNDNCVEVWVRPAPRPRVSAIVTLQPLSDYLEVVNRTETVPAGSPVHLEVRRRPGSTSAEVVGRLPLDSPPRRYYLTVEDPGLFFLTTFRYVLRREGIEVRGRCRLADVPTDTADFHPLLRFRSSLVRTVKVTNTRSQNFYAESLLKVLGARVLGRPGTFRKGAEVLRRFLADAGVGRPDYVVVDGSGLSRANRLSAFHITNLLRYMAGRPSGAVYRASLSRSGLEGGLRRRLCRAPYRGRVHAKTGTLHRVSALSGYVETLEGGTLVFSILVNDYPCPTERVRALQDEVCRVLVRFGD